MTKTFCDGCGKEAGTFGLDHFKTVNGKRVRLQVTARVDDSNDAHICDKCGAILMAEALEKVRGIVAARQNQIESQ